MRLIGASGPFVRKVRIALAEKRMAFELVDESPYAAGSPIAEFNPLGKMPVLVTDDGTSLFDSRVIVEYLDAASPVHRLLPDEWMARIAIKRSEALADGVCDALVALVTERKRPVTPEGEALLARQREKIERGVAGIARELGTKPWCGGERFSLADIATGCALFHLDLRLPDFLWRARHPELAALAARLAARPSFLETAPAPA
jgi:glutathione S-transferase